MKNSFLFLSLICILLVASSCASIVSKSYYPVVINSTPSEALVTIMNRNGEVTFKGNTPAIVELKSSSGFFRKASYVVKFEKDGYEPKIIPIVASLDGWYIGNLLFGGFIGFLIVDPATGAMYKINQKIINQYLTESVADNSTIINELKIYSIDDIPEDWKNALVEIEE